MFKHRQHSIRAS